MVSRELSTIVEGKNWVVQTSTSQKLIVMNYHALQDISNHYEYKPIPMKLKNFFMHKDSLAVKQYKQENEEEDMCAIMLASSVILSTITALCIFIYFIRTQ